MPTIGPECDSYETVTCALVQKPGRM